MSGSPLSVALLNFAYWPEVRRGNERLLHDLAVGLRDRGHRPRILTSHPKPPSHAVEEGIPVTRHWRPPDAPLRLRNIQENLTHLPFAYASLRRGSDDVAHALFLTDGLAACRWANHTGRPAIFTATGIPQRRNVSNLRLRLRILEEVTTQSDAVVVISEAARDGMWRWLGVESHVIYPGVDLRRFAPGTRAQAPTIACVATPDDPRKRVSLLVDAFTRLRRTRPDAELHLVRPRSERLAAELTGVDGVRLFPGDRDVSAEMLRSAWVSSLCSEHEAFGLVLVESLACGTPVVGAHHGAIPEVIDRPEVGRLFAGDDAGELERALLETLELADASGTAEACRARAADFSLERTAAEHETLYRELLAA